MLSHKAVHLIQGINEQKVHSIFCSSNALWIPCHNKEVMLHFYSANLMRDASLNDRVELRILGDVGAKILVINFDTPGVQLTNLAMVASSYSLHLGRDGERMRVAEAGETVLVGLPPFNAEHPQTIFDNILNRKIPWPAVPEEMSPEAQDLIDRNPGAISAKYELYVNNLVTVTTTVSPFTWHYP
ncbi:putative serine/threonine protein kinase [Arachis hypogaea]|nr:putative serine/threonine protein kinase [Arachis hypogaea]